MGGITDSLFIRNSPDFSPTSHCTRRKEAKPCMNMRSCVHPFGLVRCRYVECSFPEQCKSDHRPFQRELDACSNPLGQQQGNCPIL